MAKFLKCGCLPNCMYATEEESNGIPACGIHYCHEFMDEEIDLSGRCALCVGCKLTITKSEDTTDFLRYTGPEETVDSFYCGCGE